MMRKSTHTIIFSFIFGMFTGLLPCAILYPAFAMALATGNPLLGGISMGSFFSGNASRSFAIRSWISSN
jgi:sulfite exporter TauE/SafE